jgi:hypothetical protein
VTSGYTAPTYTFTYSRTIPVNPNGCTTDPNTVAITGLTDPSPLDNSASATVCPTVNGLTIGYWQNKNGQGRILATGTTVNTITSPTKSAKNCSAIATSLEQYAPFQDITSFAGVTDGHYAAGIQLCGSSPSLGASTATGVVGYVYTVIKNATCTSKDKTCNTMLKAQMLATALNVYFHVTNGSENIDLVHGCSMLDFSGGTASCNGAENWGPAFDNQTQMTVSQMLTFAASQSNVGGTVWYGQIKPTQVLAKDAFDAINNSAALSI